MATAQPASGASVADDASLQRQLTVPLAPALQRTTTERSADQVPIIGSSHLLAHTMHSLGRHTASSTGSGGYPMVHSQRSMGQLLLQQLGGLDGVSSQRSLAGHTSGFSQHLSGPNPFASQQTAAAGSQSPMLNIESEELAQRIQVHERLGGGTSARVYRAILDDSVTVAMKVMHPQSAQREGNVKQFFKEASMMHKLQHRHVVKVLGVCHVPPGFGRLPTRRYTWAILQEFCEEGSLSQRVVAQSRAPESPQYSDAEALRWMTQLAWALDHLHSQSPPIIHRDVKCENVLLTIPRGNDALLDAFGSGLFIKLTDFGTAVELDSSRSVKVRRRSSSVDGMLHPAGHSAVSGGLFRSPGSSGRSSVVMLPNGVCAPDSAGPAGSHLATGGSLRRSRVSGGVESTLGRTAHKGLSADGTHMFEGQEGDSSVLSHLRAKLSQLSSGQEESHWAAERISSGSVNTAVRTSPARTSPATPARNSPLRSSNGVAPPTSRHHSSADGAHLGAGEASRRRVRKANSGVQAAPAVSSPAEAPRSRHKEGDRHSYVYARYSDTGETKRHRPLSDCGRTVPLALRSVLRTGSVGSSASSSSPPIPRANARAPLTAAAAAAVTTKPGVSSFMAMAAQKNLLLKLELNREASSSEMASTSVDSDAAPVEGAAAVTASRPTSSTRLAPRRLAASHGLPLAPGGANSGGQNTPTANQTSATVSGTASLGSAPPGPTHMAVTLQHSLSGSAASFSRARRPSQISTLSPHKLRSADADLRHYAAGTAQEFVAARPESPPARPRSPIDPVAAPIPESSAELLRVSTLRPHSYSSLLNPNLKRINSQHSSQSDHKQHSSDDAGGPSSRPASFTSRRSLDVKIPSPRAVSRGGSNCSDSRYSGDELASTVPSLMHDHATALAALVASHLAGGTMAAAMLKPVAPLTPPLGPLPVSPHGGGSRISGGGRSSAGGGSHDATVVLHDAVRRLKPNPISFSVGDIARHPDALHINRSTSDAGARHEAAVSPRTRTSAASSKNSLDLQRTTSGAAQAKHSLDLVRYSHRASPPKTSLDLPRNAHSAASNVILEDSSRPAPPVGHRQYSRSSAPNLSQARSLMQGGAQQPQQALLTKALHNTPAAGDLSRMSSPDRNDGAGQSSIAGKSLSLNSSSPRAVQLPGSPRHGGLMPTSPRSRRNSMHLVHSPHSQHCSPLSPHGIFQSRQGSLQGSGPSPTSSLSRDALAAALMAAPPPAGEEAGAAADEQLSGTRLHHDPTGSDTHSRFREVLSARAGQMSSAQVSFCDSETSHSYGWNQTADGHEYEAVYTLTGRAGTCIYMAPEVTRNELYNEKADVFSFGIVMYEVLCRKLLAQSQASRADLEVLAQRMELGARPLKPKGINPQAWAIIEWCWKQDPADRPSMYDVARTLESIANPLATEARPADVLSTVLSHVPLTDPASSPQHGSMTGGGAQGGAEEEVREPGAGCAEGDSESEAASAATAKGAAQQQANSEQEAQGLCAPNCRCTIC